MNLVIVTVLVFIFDIPFGYWRNHVKKFSFQWFLAIHIPVPFIVMLRVFSNIGFEFYTYIFLVSAFFLGQRYGVFLYKKISIKTTNTACLVMDYYKYIENKKTNPTGDNSVGL